MDNEDDAYDLGSLAAIRMLEFLSDSTNQATDGRDADMIFRGVTEALFFVAYNTNPNQKEVDDLISDSVSKAKAMIEERKVHNETL